MSALDDHAVVGLRERKKAKTRAAIQSEALRLFQAQGYDATTVEQIAEAAEVSESTLFRYFPTKEALVMWDAFDPLLVDAFRRQPPELSPIEALRASFRAVFEHLSPEQWVVQNARTQLILAVPQLRAAALENFTNTISLAAEMVAERVGRQPEDFEVRNLSGAVIGIAMSVMLATAGDPDADWLGLLDRAFAHLAAGLPL